MSAQPQRVSEPLFSEPTFGEARPTPDPAYFNVAHPDDNPLYNELKQRHLANARPFQKSRLGDGDLFTLESALGSLGATKLQQIRQAGKIVFHTVGDTGSVKSTEFQNLVSDAMVADCHAFGAADTPAFFFHLGDVVYSFAEARY
jgi:hypothetical protein